MGAYISLEEILNKAPFKASTTTIPVLNCWKLGINGLLRFGGGAPCIRVHRSRVHPCMCTYRPPPTYLHMNHYKPSPIIPRHSLVPRDCLATTGLHFSCFTRTYAARAPACPRALVVTTSWARRTGT